jgi:uncharacterized protein YfaS (alpha-2-macroglobulin family)
MLRKSRASVLSVVVILAGVGIWKMTADTPPPQSQRDAALKAMQAGNFKDAYESFRKLALNPMDEPRKVGEDLTNAVQCLIRLGRVDEADEFREAVIQAHGKNWRLLETAAQSYSQLDHHGYIVAGKFYRGYRHGGGRFVFAPQRDRTRALQLMQQAQGEIKNEAEQKAVAQFSLHFANMLLNGAGNYEPWRLQYLTDLAQLPDYEDSGYYGGNAQGAPVDANGQPIYHHLLKSYEAAKTDGERWRWMLAQVAIHDPGRQSEVDNIFADFLRNQLDVTTMAQYGRLFDEEDRKNDQSGTYALHTLKDDETIARLPIGVRRFSVPDEFNWIKIYEQVAARGKSAQGAHARDMLARIYEDRRQYDKSADGWKKAIAEYGPGPNNSRQLALDQIVGSWGRFETNPVLSTGKNATVDFRFRNGNRVQLEAWPINVHKLLADTRTYLVGRVGQLDWQETNIADLGYKLVERRQNQYFGPRAADWAVDLKPRPGHVDDRVTIQTPLQNGAYLVTARMAGGNVSRIIVWISDTVIVKKQLDGQAMYYIADAASGRPIPKAQLTFFGWRQVQVAPNANQWRVESVEFQDTANEDGQVFVSENKMSNQYQWLVTAHADNRFAYYGFNNVWFGRQYDPEYNQVKVFSITDRPVYRPTQTMQFKFWVEHAKYDQADSSEFANQPFIVRIHNPKGEKIFEKEYTTDRFGGLAGEFPIAKDAMLGQYLLQLTNRQANINGAGHFRIEEYKKPEFEVTVEAPTKPVQLGEKVEATIKAKYYFGAPVVNAKVKYKVLRSSYDSRWFPRGAWDWFYGSGYWWFASDYTWYPGWNNWGCMRPLFIWWRGQSAPPEVVMENEVPIGPDGTVKVPIDTSLAKEMHGNQDHKYSITAEVVDESRRTIVGTGDVLVSRNPFRVYSWVDRGHYRVGDTIHANFRAQTLDHKPVEGKGELTLFQITYNDRNEPVEHPIQNWKVDTNAEGQAQQQIKAQKAGQFRISYKLTDSNKHTMEGGYVFVVRGEGIEGKDFRFNDIELVTDKREYAPGEKVKLLVNTDKLNGTVLLFLRPTNGVYLPPKVIRVKGKSFEEELVIVQKDMPNCFVEALTVADGRIHTEVREIIVPPEKRVLNVEVLPSQQEYKPGQKANVRIKLTDFNGKPYTGSTVLTMYDKSVDYISGGSNVPEIKEFFWKWRRHHNPQTESTQARYFYNLLRSGEIGMSNLGVFGEGVVEELAWERGSRRDYTQLGPDGGFGGRSGPMFRNAGGMPGMTPMAAALPGPGGGGGAMAPGMAREEGNALGSDWGGADKAKTDEAPGGAQPGGQPPVPTVRKNFADTAFWTGSLITDKDGVAEVNLTMPENLTGWKIKCWAMGLGTKVGEGATIVTTKKDLLVRMQAPRFFVQTDEVVLSANVHNYLKADKDVMVTLELDGGVLAPMGNLQRQVKIAANGEHRVDWRVRVQSDGEAIVRMKAVADTEADAIEMRFPAYVHGMLKTDSFSGVVRPDKDSAQIAFTVPEQRRMKESRLEVRYSPTLAGAMVDALPYMVEYPYGCTEQTLNRFLPTVITQHVLQRMGLNLKDIEQKRTNLNAQEIGDDKERAKGWKRFPRNPVFNEQEVHDMAVANINALQNMQLSDGGWGWFSGFGEHSWPHTTAVVVHGLQIAKSNDVVVPPAMLDRGIAWLKNYQAEQTQMIRNAPTKTKPWKEHADNLDAFVYMVLMDGNVNNEEMRDYLYRDRNHLAVYGKAMLGLTLHKQQRAEELAMILKNIEQFVVQDEENQTAYLRLPPDNSWWYWYGSEIESDAYYLKLLARTNPKGETAPRLVKYLLNNRKHATYWNSTRDTAICIEAMSEYLVASGEDKPDMTVEIWLDGKKFKDSRITAENLFTFDNQFVLFGDAVESGKHVLEVRRKGKGPVYFNAYETNFTLEDFITKAGLEVKVNRKYYKLTPVDKKIKVQGSSGQALDQKVEKYERTELPNLATLKSGDLVEIELEIDSKNDYEYLVFEDPKAAGFEPMLVRSGYNPNDLGAYMELRDDRVCFFVRALARGKSSVSYRMRAEIPGKFSALPTRASAMYAPELRGNSDEIKVNIVD